MLGTGGETGKRVWLAGVVGGGGVIMTDAPPPPVRVSAVIDRWAVSLSPDNTRRLTT